MTLLSWLPLAPTELAWGLVVVLIWPAMMARTMTAAYQVVTSGYQVVQLCVLMYVCRKR